MPADGIVECGQSHVDESMLTGEALLSPGNGAMRSSVVP